MVEAAFKIAEDRLEGSRSEKMSFLTAILGAAVEAAENEWADHMPFNPSDMSTVEIDPVIAGLVWGMPWSGDGWTVQQRDAWVQAFIAVTNLLYFTVETKREEKSAVPVAATAPAPTPEPTSSEPDKLPEIPALADEQPVQRFDPEPYRGSKDAARIVIDLIRSVGKRAHVWLNREGRVKVAGDEYKPTETDQLVGVYTPDVKKSVVAADLKAAGSE